MYHESVHERGFIHSANIGTFITVSNIGLNLLLITLIFLRRSTRRQFVYQQVANLALSDLAFSVMVDPFTVYFELQPWRLGPSFCVAWMVLDSALPFVSFLVLVALNIDRLIYAINPELYQRAYSRLPLWVFSLLLPWILGLGTLLPLWLLNAVTWPQYGICMYGVTMKAAVASAVVSLYLPCVALIVLTVLVLVTIIGGMPEDLHEVPVLRGGVARGPVSCARPTVTARQGVNFDVPHRTVPQPNTPLVSGIHQPATTPASPHVCSNLQVKGNAQNVQGGNIARNASSTLLCEAYQDSTGRGLEEGVGGRENPMVKKSHRRLVVALCVLNILTVITQLPYGAISMLKPECMEQSCQSTIKLIQALSWMRSVTFSLHPLCLITMTTIRKTFCMACRRPEDVDREHDDRQEAANSGNTKSDNIELASINTAVVSVPHKGPGTML
ncbi:tyramine receptor 1-like [Littorina saxatilis]